MAEEKNLDDLLNEVVRPPCTSYFHSVAEKVHPLLLRARERVRAGERVSPTALIAVIQREFGVTVERKISYWLRDGCKCHE